jgi:TolA-binding protein
MKRLWLVCSAVLAMLCATMWAQTSAPAKKAKPGTRSRSTAARTAKKSAAERDVQTLREALDAQQEQIRQLREELQRRDSALQQVQQQVNTLQATTAQAQTAVQTATSTGQQNTAALDQVKSTVSDLKTNQVNTALSLQTEQKRIGELENPAQIRYKGITLTPGGFIEAAGVYRTHNENASVNSAPGDFSIPLGGTTNAHMSEFRFDARQSRLTLLGEGKLGDVKASAYYEVDFLGAAPTANENQSNSFNLRQRQLWASTEFSNGLSFTGGQQWSLFTLHRKGMANRSEFLPLTVNAQYVIGYDWARQPGLRVIKNFSNRVWAGFAVENPSTVVNVQGVTIGGTASKPPIFGFSNSPNAQSPNGNFTLSNTPGANGVSTNLAPDLIAKLTFEPGWGHFELKGMGRFFRDRVNGSNDHVFAGGIGAAMILPLVKSKVDLIGEGLVGNGIGRYGAGGGVDVTLRPDGTIAPIRSYHVLLGPEVHIGKKLDLYVYGGEEYYQRRFEGSIGYGSPSLNNTGCRLEQTSSTALSCPNQTRYAFEVTPGFWYRFYKGSAGTAQLGMQYSYSKRALWSGVGGGPAGVENQVYSSFRYYLP